MTGFKATPVCASTKDNSPITVLTRLAKHGMTNDAHSLLIVLGYIPPVVEKRPVTLLMVPYVAVTRTPYWY